MDRLGRWLKSVTATATLNHDRLKQGAHPDPDDPLTKRPDPAGWPRRRQLAFASETMSHYISALRLSPASGVRQSVLDDLGNYFNLDSEECVQRCLNWEEWSVREWHSKPRHSNDAIVDFYLTTMSWAFELLWYAYMQAEGYAYPVSVAIARSIPQLEPGMRHLDFGSGVGVTSQLFMSLGLESDLSDVSTSLLAFARFRLERRRLQARYINLSIEGLQPAAYDVITAVDTLVHVPDLAATARALHRSLRPGGFLFANFDVRPKTPENAWHLYSNDLPLRWILQRTGFEPEESLDGMITRYRRVDPKGLGHGVRGARDTLAFRTPLRPVFRFTRQLIKARR